MRPIATLLAAALVPIAIVFVVNLLVDPFCFFGPSNSLISRKYLYDERGQKTNYIRKSARNYDALILGSSRTAFIDPADFRHGRYFNYAASGLLPFEYAGFIEVAKKSNDIKTVVIGFDFFATNATEHSKDSKDSKPASIYEADASYRRLLHYAGLRYSRVSISCSLRTVCLERSYTRNFTRTWNDKAPQDREETTRLHLAQYAKTYYGDNYRFDPAFESILKKLRKDNPGIRLIGFTSPPSSELFELMMARGLSGQYARWLRLLVENLDEVHDFMGNNSVTMNARNYLDAHHFSPLVGRFVAQRIEGNDSTVPGDFGVRLAATNVEEHIRNISSSVGRRLARDRQQPGT